MSFFFNNDSDKDSEKNLNIELTLNSFPEQSLYLPSTWCFGGYSSLTREDPNPLIKHDLSSLTKNKLFKNKSTPKRNKKKIKAAWVASLKINYKGVMGTFSTARYQPAPILIPSDVPLPAETPTERYSYEETCYFPNIAEILEKKKNTEKPEEKKKKKEKPEEKKEDLLHKINMVTGYYKSQRVEGRKKAIYIDGSSQVDFFFYYNKGMTKSKKKKCPIPPQQLESLQRDLLKFCEFNDMADYFELPPWLSNLTGIFTSVDSYRFVNIIESYNVLYNLYWTLRAFGIYVSGGYLQRQFLKIEATKKKKTYLEIPFEFFLNHERSACFERGGNRIERSFIFRTSFSLLDLNIGKLDAAGLKGDAMASLLFSLYMGKKNFCLAQPAKDSFSIHKKLISEKRPIDEKFLSFVKKETRKMFSDFKWKDNYRIVAPSTSYTKGGPPILLHDYLLENGVTRQEWNNWIEKKELFVECPNLYEEFRDFIDRPKHRHDAKLIVESGKARVITTNHPATFLMKPFQWNIHRHLRKKSVFDYIGKQVNTVINIEKKKEYNCDDWLLSGDYTNSTDFIPKEFTKAIYDVILEKIDFPYMKELVGKSLDEEVMYPDGDLVSLESGQMMGGLLSFPALCIMNWCISEYVGIYNKKINGDDLLALCSKEARSRWIEESIPLGMMPNDSKSHFHPKYGTFNSMLIKKRNNHCLQRLPHYSVSKLEKSSLNDSLGLSLGENIYKSLPELRNLFAQNFYKKRDRIDLYTGDKYYENEKKKITEYDPYLIGRENFLGKCGGMSKFYDEEDPEKAIDAHWQWRKDEMEDFVVGNGYYYGLKDAGPLAEYYIRCIDKVLLP